jgi:hypothetical protein
MKKIISLFTVLIALAANTSTADNTKSITSGTCNKTEKSFAVDDRDGCCKQGLRCCIMKRSEG